MKYLLDTNILSETVRVQPDLNVKKWLQGIPSEALFISVLTVKDFDIPGLKVINPFD